MVGGKKCFGPDNADPSESFLTNNVPDSTNNIQFDWDFDTDKDISQTDAGEWGFASDAITDETRRPETVESTQPISQPIIIGRFFFEKSFDHMNHTLLDMSVKNL